MEKILYFGGQKSGKSALAEEQALKFSNPYYIATYNNSFNDLSMQKKIQLHKERRKDSFYTIQEPFDLTKVIKENSSYLIDCISMWIFNNIDNTTTIFKQLEYLEKIKANIVFVLNSVDGGIVPADKLSRDFVDLTGLVGQKIASFSTEVYEVKFGLKNRLK
jgi:adenosylcobinamide kinase/adenosylcobinamide-phosphate guanylyltransferase